MLLLWACASLWPVPASGPVPKGSAQTLLSSSLLFQYLLPETHPSLHILSLQVDSNS